MATASASGPRFPLARPLALLLAIGLAHLAASALAATGWSEPAIPLESTAVLAAALLGLLAVLRVPGTIPVVAFALVLGLAVGHFGGPDLAGRAGDPPGAGALLLSLRRLGADVAFGTGPLNSAIYSLLAAAIGGLCAWEAVRLRRPLLALAPVAAAFAVGILNSTGDHAVDSLQFVGLVIALWLAGAAARLGLGSVPDLVPVGASVRRRLTGPGAALGVLVLLVAGVAPPLSSRDTSGVLDAPLSRLRTSLGEPAAGIQVGFSFDVPLAGSLTTSSAQTVLTYTYDGLSPTAAPLYLRGVDLGLTANGQWRQGLQTIDSSLLPEMPVRYLETYRQLAPLTIHVQVRNPVADAPLLVFFPGQLTAADRGLELTTTVPPRPTGSLGVYTVEGARTTVAPALSYTLQTLVSTASEADLEGAGARYPAWVSRYSDFGRGFAGTYRPPAVIARVRALAQRITITADNPYAKAKALETYLRDNFRYTLTPPATPSGRDPIDFFLFTSRQGYCQFFATALGDMLRSLGIPTRLVNGFGAGTPGGPGGEFTVSTADAHTWVEVYFPGFGWIPFEPTPQVGFGPIPRGTPVAATAPDPSLPDPGPSPIATAPPAGSAAAEPPPPAPVRAGTLTLPLGLLLSLLLLTALALTGAWLWRPRDVPGAWRRLRLLGRLSGVPDHPWDTPREYGHRFAKAHPDLATVLVAMADTYSEGLYARRPSSTRAIRMVSGWSPLGTLLLRRALRRRARL